MLADLDPEMVPPADCVRPLGDGRSKLKAVIDADCRQRLEQLRGLLSHVDPRMTVAQLAGRIVQEALDRHDRAGCRHEAGRRCYFDAEALRVGPRDSGGGAAAGVAAGRRPLQLP